MFVYSTKLRYFLSKFSLLISILKSLLINLNDFKNEITSSLFPYCVFIFDNDSDFYTRRSSGIKAANFADASPFRHCLLQAVISEVFEEPEYIEEIGFSRRVGAGDKNPGC